MDGCEEFEKKGPSDCNAWCIPDSYDSLKVIFTNEQR